MKLSIIIPAHNEAATLPAVLEKVDRVNLGAWQKEVIAVNDASSDATPGILAAWRSGGDGRITLSHERNLGKGSAIRTALGRASGDYVLIQDADLEYDPADIPGLLSFIENGEPAAIFGDRGVKRYPERGFHFVLGAKLLTWVFNVLYGIWLHDLYTGYKLIPAERLKSLNLQSTGFEFEAEVAAKLRRSGVRIIEAPINYRPRSVAAGKHIRARDAAVGLWVIIKARFS